ncbi:hypothetical protein [Streptomyces noursei]|uniref:hypothetical protein n=1 Tax=Streptomyces noursei TaxID=1971 RepID=UPI0021A3CEA5|nr:hypothetical protein [Streptomyces noursei]UWS69864.1 hypothetical protein N1H47_00360 [Streptomyces noursei]UWS76917.1 hypothetical protein N1H47_40175 [Streptomyces noursei]
MKMPTKTELSTNATVTNPTEVHERLARHLLVDGFPFVLDLERSQGSWLVDAISGDAYLDMYTFFASSPLGINRRCWMISCS